MLAPVSARRIVTYLEQTEGPVCGKEKGKHTCCYWHTGQNAAWEHECFAEKPNEEMTFKNICHTANMYWMS